MTPDPHPYAIAAQMIAANLQQLRGLYVSVVPSGIEIQGHPSLPIDEQISALRRFADHLGDTVTVSDPITTTSWAKNYTIRAHVLRSEYDGVPVHGFVHEHLEVGRTDEIRNGSPVTVLGGAA